MKERKQRQGVIDETIELCTALFTETREPKRCNFVGRIAMGRTAADVCRSIASSTPEQQQANGERS